MKKIYPSRPLTVVTITPDGRVRFQKYVKQIQPLLEEVELNKIKED